MDLTDLDLTPAAKIDQMTYDREVSMIKQEEEKQLIQVTAVKQQNKTWQI